MDDDDNLLPGNGGNYSDYQIEWLTLAAEGKQICLNEIKSGGEELEKPCIELSARAARLLILYDSNDKGVTELAEQALKNYRRATFSKKPAGEDDPVAKSIVKYLTNSLPPALAKQMEGYVTSMWSTAELIQWEIAKKVFLPAEFEVTVPEVVDRIRSKHGLQSATDEWNKIKGKLRAEREETEKKRIERQERFEATELNITVEDYRKGKRQADKSRQEAAENETIEDTLNALFRRMAPVTELPEKAPPCSMLQKHGDSWYIVPKVHARYMMLALAAKSGRKPETKQD